MHHANRKYRTVASANRAMTFCMAATLCLIFGTLAMAQPGGDPPPKPDSPPAKPDAEHRPKSRSQFRGGPPKIDTWRILELESVRKEITLTNAQLNGIGGLRARMKNAQKPDWKTWRDLSEEERTAKREELQRASEARKEEYESGLKEILKPEQYARMREIQIQAQGFPALFDKAVAEKVGLTPPQSEAIHESIKRSIQEGMQQLRSDRSMPIFEKFQQVVRAAETKALKLLTEEQATKFKKMQGAEFTFSEEDRRRLKRRPSMRNREGKARPRKADGPRGASRGEKPEEKAAQ